MRSRFLADLNVTEINAYFDRGGGTALLPVGSQEMHGPHLPTGTDMFITRALALKLAEVADGLVLPDMPYTWAGSTDGFAGTISTDPGSLARMLEEIILMTFRGGFRRLALVSVHGGNNYLLPLLVRRFFEKYGRPIVLLHIGLDDEQAAAACGGSEEWGKAAEASLLLAALQILGQPTLYTVAELAYDDRMPPFPASLLAMGVPVGYFMQDPRQHACPSRHTSLRLGREVLERKVQAALPILQAIDAYAAETAGQPNKGWQRESATGNGVWSADCQSARDTGKVGNHD